MSSGLPGGTVADHRIEDCQQLTCESDERDLCWFSGATKALVHVFEHWIESGSVHRSEIEHRTKRSAAEADPALPDLLSAVARKGRNTDERGDLTPRQRAELREIDQKSACETGADGGCASENLQRLVPFGVLV